MPDAGIGSEDAGAAGNAIADSAVADEKAAACGDAQAQASPGVVADRLAKFLWNVDAAPPSLADQVAQTASPQGVVSVAKTMLADPQARAGVAAFFSSWLRLGDLPTTAKPAGVLTPELIASMQKEAPAFGTSVVFDGDGKYQTLMTAPYTFVDQTLAAHYGMPAVTGTAMQKVPYDTPERIGILGGAGVLTRFSGAVQLPLPPRRFWLLTETIFCDFISAPLLGGQQNVVDMPIRQWITDRTAGGMCLSCHQTVNPFGFAFLRFDTYGRYQTTDNIGGVILDSSGTAPAGGILVLRAPITFTGEPDLITQLVQKPETRRCFSTRLLDYAMRPRPQLPGPLSLDVDQCSVDQAQAAFEASGGDIRALIVAATGTPGFLAP